jgi:hypothetical protein
MRPAVHIAQCRRDVAMFCRTDAFGDTAVESLTFGRESGRIIDAPSTRRTPRTLEQTHRNTLAAQGCDQYNGSPSSGSESRRLRHVLSRKERRSHHFPHAFERRP